MLCYCYGMIIVYVLSPKTVTLKPESGVQNLASLRTLHKSEGTYCNVGL